MSLSAIAWHTRDLCLLAVLDNASAMYESGAHGMFLWPHPMTAMVLGFRLVGWGVGCLFLQCTPYLGER